MMTETADLAQPILTGQDIGQAEKATRAVFERLLSTVGLRFEVWVNLNLVATSATPLDADELVARVVQGLKITESAANAAFAELVDQGLVLLTPFDELPSSTANPEVTLTVTGATRFGQVRAALGRITQRLYGDVPTEDLVIAHRVLARVTERANAELVS
jgi:hypothetical protein